MSGVSKICAREILDSRGNPTVEVDITTSKGKKNHTPDCTFVKILGAAINFGDLAANLQRLLVSELLQSGCGNSIFRTCIKVGTKAAPKCQEKSCH